MKYLVSFLLVVGLLFGNAFSATFKVERNASIFADVNKITSQVGAKVASAKVGESLEIVSIYSAYVKVEAKAGTGWVWYELMKELGNDLLIPDPEKGGKDGVAIVSEPNTTKVIGAVLGNETVKVVGKWNTWVTVKKDGVTGVIFIGEGTIVQ